MSNIRFLVDYDILSYNYVALCCIYGGSMLLEKYDKMLSQLSVS